METVSCSRNVETVQLCSQMTDRAIRLGYCDGCGYGRITTTVRFVSIKHNNEIDYPSRSSRDISNMSKTEQVVACPSAMLIVRRRCGCAQRGTPASAQARVLPCDETVSESQASGIVEWRRGISLHDERFLTEDE